jgi:uncharacterized membrane protein
MEPSLTAKTKRIESIDILRGIAMVIMALDHVRDYFHIGAFTGDPLDLSTTTPLLYFTRWVTHFCAPIFVFLSGTSIYLQSRRKTKKELSSFLIKRGLWLVFVEVAIVSLAWSFNPFYNVLFLQVIWAIGISMVILGLLIWLPFRYILLLGLVIVFGHNLLDKPESVQGFQGGFWWDLLHSSRFNLYSFAPNHFAVIAYPFLPWTGVMMLGYCMGVFFGPEFSVEQRKHRLVWAGFVMIGLFVVLRYFNLYGDPYAWSRQKNSLLTFLSFMNVHKYPPSLLFLCITIGPSLILLALIENTKNRLTEWLRIYGRVAFFYYILHLYLIHLLAAISFFMRGHGWKEVPEIAQNFPFLFVVPSEGYGLGVVYLVWAFVVLTLYPLCRWYNNYKTAHKEKWWLGYL